MSVNNRSTQDIRAVMQGQRDSNILMNKARNHAYHFISNVNHRPVFPTQESIDNLELFDEPFPIETQDGMRIIDLLHQHGSPATVDYTGGRYFGFVNGGIIPASLATKWLTDVWDVNAALNVMSPINAKIEAVVESWLREIFSLPASTVAGFVSGTSTATLAGLAAARYRILSNKGWDVNKRGLSDAPKLRIVLSDGAHGTVLKALALLGIGTDNIEVMESDEQGRIDVTKMPELDDSTILVLQAGNVNSGAYDDFLTLCTLAKERGAWVHIDGAFGLWAAASAKHRYLTDGIELADSWSVDGHKTLNTPYDSGVVLCRDPEALYSAMQLSGDYLHYNAEREGGRFTPELSRRARAIEMWAALKFLGADGLEQLVDGFCDRARQFADELSQRGFRVLNDVVFNQVLVACDTPEMTERTLEAVQKSEVCWMGGTKWKSEPVIRLSVCSWVTDENDILLSAEAMERAYESVSSRVAEVV